MTIIFCIDISGSMCVTTPLKASTILKSTKKKKDKLKEFMKFSDGSYQHLDQSDRTSTYVSRLECVIAAIENQLLQLSHAAPHVKIGLVLFNNEVILIGDGILPPKIITGDKLSNKLVHFAILRN